MLHSKLLLKLQTLSKLCETALRSAGNERGKNPTGNIQV